MEPNIFQAHRLVLARHRRALNKAQLAKSAGLTPQMISAYEQDKKAPPPETLDRLALALDFPVAFFYAGSSDLLPRDAASFRSLARMKVSQANAALAAGSICMELNHWFEERFDLPAAALPDLDPGYIDAEGAAAHVRAAWGIGDAPITNVLHLLESHGVRVFALPTDHREVDAFSFWDEQENSPYILLGVHKTPERAIFDLAHELGHLVMHRDHAAPRGRDEEKQADQFASTLLMPRGDVHAASPRFPSLATLVTLKHRWKVSTAALNYRLHDLGLTSDWHYRSLCIEISRMGRDRELNSLPREQSQMLAKVFALLRAEGISRADIAEALHLYPADLDAVLNGLVLGSVDGDGVRTSGVRPNLRVVPSDQAGPAGIRGDG